MATRADLAQVNALGQQAVDAAAGVGSAIDYLTGSTEGDTMKNIGQATGISSALDTVQDAYDQGRQAVENQIGRRGLGAVTGGLSSFIGGANPAGIAAGVIGGAYGQDFDDAMMRAMGYRGTNAFSGALQGMGYGSMFGAPGMAVGALVGGIGGALMPEPSMQVQAEEARARAGRMESAYGPDVSREQALALGAERLAAWNKGVPTAMQQWGAKNFGWTSPVQERYDARMQRAAEERAYAKSDRGMALTAAEMGLARAAREREAFALGVHSSQKGGGPEASTDGGFSGDTESGHGVGGIGGPDGTGGGFGGY